MTNMLPTLSTQNLAPLPGLDSVRKTLQSVAMLEAILFPDLDFRRYTFERNFEPGVDIARMLDEDEGAECVAVFNARGCVIKGCWSEAPMLECDEGLWPGVLDLVPAEFAPCLALPIFHYDATTFCIWRRSSDAAWARGEIVFPDVEDPDGSAGLLAILDGRPLTYTSQIAEFVHAPSVRAIYAHEPLTAECVAHLNSEISLDDLAWDIETLGYPHSVARHSVR